MVVNVIKDNNVMTLKVEGRIDATTAPTLDNHIKELPNDVTSLVIDLEEVKYISSAGLRVLLSAQKLMNKLGSMKLINVCDLVMEILEITGFVDILTIE